MSDENNIPFGNADISFLTFEDEQGQYKLKGIGPELERIKVYLTDEEIAIETAQAMARVCVICGKAGVLCECDDEE